MTSKQARELAPGDVIRPGAAEITRHTVTAVREGYEGEPVLHVSTDRCAQGWSYTYRPDDTVRTG